MLRRVVISLSALVAGCTCSAPQPARPAVPRAEARIALTDATGATRDALWAALSRHGQFTGAGGAEPGACVTVHAWPVTGDDAARLAVETRHVGADCDPEAVAERTAVLDRHHEARPDVLPDLGRGFQHPALAHRSTWRGFFWKQTYTSRIHAPLPLDGTPAEVDAMLPRDVERTGPVHVEAMQTWTLPPWTFGRSTYRGVLTAARCAQGGPDAVILTLSLPDKDHAFLPFPSRAALDRVIADLGDRVPDAFPDDATTRCAPEPP